MRRYKLISSRGECSSNLLGRIIWTPRRMEESSCRVVFLLPPFFPPSLPSLPGKLASLIYTEVHHHPTLSLPPSAHPSPLRLICVKLVIYTGCHLYIPTSSLFLNPAAQCHHLLIYYACFFSFTKVDFFCLLKFHTLVVSYIMSLITSAVLCSYSGVSFTSLLHTLCLSIILIIHLFFFPIFVSSIPATRVFIFVFSSSI